MLGGLVGVGVGLSSDVWEEVPLGEQISITPSRDGGVALGYEYRF